MKTQGEKCAVMLEALREISDLLDASPTDGATPWLRAVTRGCALKAIAYATSENE